MTEPTTSSNAVLESIIDTHRDREGPLLPILNEVQETFGCIDETAKRTIAEALNLTRAEVHGVVSFYHDYREKPAGRPVLKLCGAEACQSMGADLLARRAREWCGDRADVETVYCLGLCSAAPSAMTQGKVHARLDEEKLARLIGSL